MATRTYRLKVVRDGYEFEAEGDKAFVVEMLRRFAPQPQQETPAHTKQESEHGRGRKSPPAAPGRAKKLSIREFVQQLGLKKHTDITVAFGYYLEKVSDIPEFSAADINNCYYEAKLESSNTSQMIIQNIKAGRMMPSKRKGEKGRNRYTLTASGETFIESKLPSNS